MQSWKKREKKIYFFNIDKKKSVVKIFYKKVTNQNQIDVENRVWKNWKRDRENTGTTIVETKYHIPKRQPQISKVKYIHDFIDSKWKIYEQKVLKNK